MIFSELSLSMLVDRLLADTIGPKSFLDCEVQARRKSSSSCADRKARVPVRALGFGGAQIYDGATGRPGSGVSLVGAAWASSFCIGQCLASRPPSPMLTKSTTPSTAKSHHCWDCILLYHAFETIIPAEVVLCTGRLLLKAVMASLARFLGLTSSHSISGCMDTLLSQMNPLLMYATALVHSCRYCSSAYIARHGRG